MGTILGKLFTFFNKMNVKELREKHGLTQAELAEKTNIPRDRIAKWEQGKGSPKSEDYQVLNKLFGKLEREDVPRELITVQEPHVSYLQPHMKSKTENPGSAIQKDPTPTDPAILDLIESNNTLTKTNERLARMLEEATKNKDDDSKKISGSPG